MAFVSGGGGGGLPPQGSQSSQPVLAAALSANPQLLEALLLQQQQSSTQQQPNILSQLMTSSLLGGAGIPGVGASNASLSTGALPQHSAAQQPAQSQQNILLQTLQSQLLLQQLLPQLQGSQQQLQNPLVNPLALYYHQLLQQQQQQQQQNLLQQLHQQQQQHVQATVASQPLAMAQSHSAFQPPHQQASSANVESHLNAQERLLQMINDSQTQGTISRRESELSMHPSAPSTSTAPADRVLTRNSSNLNPKEVGDHISRIISENEAIVQPQEPLLKRRPYHRQVGQQSSMEHESGSNSGSTRTSPGVRDVRMLQAAGRTQSLYEPLNGVRAFGGGSLTSGQPVVRPQTQPTSLNCTYCRVVFNNEVALQGHEARCSLRPDDKSKIEVVAAPIVPAPAPAAAPEPQHEISRHPLKRRLLAAAFEQEQQAAAAAAQAHPPKLARKDSGDVIVLAETKPERKDGFPLDQCLHPSLPRRKTIGSINLTSRTSSPTVAPSPSLNQQPAAAAIAAAAENNGLTTNTVPTAFSQIMEEKNFPLQLSRVPQPIGQPSPASTSNGSSAQIFSQKTMAAPAQKKEAEEIQYNQFQMKGVALTGDVTKPYFLVLADGAPKGNDLFGKNTNNRGRTRNITSETFVCLQKPQPMFVEQKGTLSMYSNWHTGSNNETESKLNVLFMGQCSARPRTGVHQFWRYTIATREGGSLKVTHSSFWQNSQLQRARQLAEAAAAESKPEPEFNIQIPYLNEMNLEDVKRAIQESTVHQKSDHGSLPETPPAVDYKMEIDEVKLEPEQPYVAQPINGDPSDEVTVPEVPKVHSTRSSSRKAEPIMGGHRTDELYVYVRGRGRGRYVCDRCGIRCKKPSMLKKHIKSHTDVRPYKCKECNFSFKTKGNLTKHLSSKTHKRRLEKGDDSDNEGRLEIATPDEDGIVEEELHLAMMDDDNCSSDEDDEHMSIIPKLEDNPFKKFGQENILLERSTHTPPSRWMIVDEDISTFWPDASSNRQCSSAPPSAIPNSPTSERADDSVNDEESVTDSVAPFTGQKPFLSSAAASSSMTAVASSVAIPMASTGIAGSTVSAMRFPGQASPMIYAYVPKEEPLKCDQCERTFRKVADLNYHQMTHNIEKQTKSRMFQCPECRIPMKTKALLAKHVEQSHGSHIDDSVTASLDPSASTQSVLVGGPASLANNPRSFMCNDCNIGFRKHGILAKHLRSKTHVMKLETLKRLPEDSLSLITKKDNGVLLNEVDTTDCEKARDSLKAIVEAIRAENARGTSAPPNAGSLECREQLAPSPVPGGATPVGGGRLVQDSPRSLADNSSPSRSRCGSAASNGDGIPRKKSDPTVTREAQFAVNNNGNKVVSANVWVPPRAEIPLGRPESTPFRVMHTVEEVDNEANRSSASSPVLRIINTNGHRSPAISNNTKCSICDHNFDNSVEMQVHMHTDHLSMKDGTYFKCPRRFCDKVYPNKDCLRNHLSAHFRADFGHEHREDDSTPTQTQNLVSGRAEDPEQRSTPLTDGSDSSCQSPSTIEVPRTVASVESHVSDELRLPCTLCPEVFADAASLQKHWFSHVASRTHVCTICDAGFTTSEALLQHTATHLANGSA